MSPTTLLHQSSWCYRKSDRYSQWPAWKLHPAIPWLSRQAESKAGKKGGGRKHQPPSPAVWLQSHRTKTKVYCSPEQWSSKLADRSAHTFVNHSFQCSLPTFMNWMKNGDFTSHSETRASLENKTQHRPSFMQIPQRCKPIAKDAPGSCAGRDARQTLGGCPGTKLGTSAGPQVTEAPQPPHWAAPFIPGSFGSFKTPATKDFNTASQSRGPTAPYKAASTHYKVFNEEER